MCRVCQPETSTLSADFSDVGTNENTASGSFVEEEDKVAENSGRRSWERRNLIAHAESNECVPTALVRGLCRGGQCSIEKVGCSLLTRLVP